MKIESGWKIPKRNDLLTNIREARVALKAAEERAVAEEKARRAAEAQVAELKNSALIAFTIKHWAIVELCSGCGSNCPKDITQCLY